MLELILKTDNHKISCREIDKLVDALAHCNFKSYNHLSDNMYKLSFESDRLIYL